MGPPGSGPAGGGAGDRARGGRLRLAVLVVPGASRDAVDGFQADGTLKLRVSAPPERGRANRATLELLARVLGLPARSVRVVSGEASRRKLVEVDGLDEAGLRARLATRPSRGGRGPGR